MNSEFEKKYCELLEKIDNGEILEHNDSTLILSEIFSAMTAGNYEGEDFYKKSSLLSNFNIRIRKIIKV